jgi:LmbE family N-acetylglucosaminyl deacetylase
MLTMPHTIVCFHAHPDDESIITGGVMARAAEAGNRVVLVVATRGEHAGFGHDTLEAGETITDRRVVETQRAADVLGVSRVEFLGYVDSGMMGTPENDAPGSFWSAELDEAAGRLADLLREENADVLTIYDDRGTYGHPDHIQVHRVGSRAAELAGTPVVLEATMSRDHLVRMMAEHRGDLPESADAPPADAIDVGVDEAVITTKVDVRDFLTQKRAAMAAHGSQIPESSFFLSMPPKMFSAAFGYEWFIRRGAPDGTKEDDFLAALP